MYHKLSVLLGAGVPVVQALRNTGQNSKGRVKKALLTVADAVASGDDLVEVAHDHRRIFDRLDLALIEAAVKSGNLPNVFQFLSEWYTFFNRLRRNILSATIFPMVLIHATAVLCPAPGLFLRQYGPTDYYIRAATILSFLYVPMLLVLGIIHLTPKTGPLRWLLDALTLKIPVFGQAVKHLALSRFCRAFGMLYKAGVPIIQGVEIACAITGNIVITGMLKSGVDSARAGNTISSGFSAKLPHDFLTIWRIGEDSGQLDDSVERLGNESADISQLLFTTLAKLFPRLVYVTVAVVWIVQIFKAYKVIFDIIKLR
jgi:type IV pilus assembly protein PilC